jgi:hypothetical protein
MTVMPVMRVWVIRVRHLLAPLAEPPLHDLDLLGLRHVDPPGEELNVGPGRATRNEARHHDRLRVMRYHSLHEVDISLAMRRWAWRRELRGRGALSIGLRRMDRSVPALSGMDRGASASIENDQQHRGGQTWPGTVAHQKAAGKRKLVRTTPVNPVHGRRRFSDSNGRTKRLVHSKTSSRSRSSEPLPSPACDRLTTTDVDGLLLDGWSPDAHGGTGARFPWEELAAVRHTVPSDISFIIAGGLTPENVSTAIRQLQPDLVDVSSGVETSPGLKDPLAIERFIAAVREHINLPGAVAPDDRR